MHRSRARRTHLAAILVGLPLVAPLTAAPSRPAIASAAEDRLPLIGSSGGSFFSRRCPGRHVLVGFRYRVGAVVDGLGIYCRKVLVSGQLGEMTEVSEMAGGNGGTSGLAICPFSGAQQVIAAQHGGGAGFGIAKLRYSCYAWYDRSRTFGGGNALLERVIRDGAAFSASATCPVATKPAVGIYGRHGAVVDAVGLICDAP